jgi:rare lipoprotein A
MKKLFLFCGLLCWCFGSLLAQADTAAKASSDTTKKPASNGKVQYGVASWYSDSFDGRRTSNGEIFSQAKLTCATHGNFRFGTWLRVTNLRNKKSVIVKVNDRMHPRMKRIVDLSRAAAKQIGIIHSGVTKVKVEVLGKKGK